MSKIVNFPACEWCGQEMVSRPARHKDGGQTLNLLTITLKTDAALSKAFFSKAGQKYSM